MDSLFQDIETAGKPTSSERWQGPRSGWISDETWRIVDQKNAYRRSPGYNQTDYSRLNRRLKLAFKSDWKRRCATPCFLEIRNSIILSRQGCINCFAVPAFRSKEWRGFHRSFIRHMNRQQRGILPIRHSRIWKAHCQWLLLFLLDFEEWYAGIQ